MDIRTVKKIKTSTAFRRIISQLVYQNSAAGLRSFFKFLFSPSSVFRMPVRETNPDIWTTFKSGHSVFFIPDQESD